MDNTMAVTTSAQSPFLSVTGLHKRYPNGVEAVRGISLELQRGEVFGLVGPNGAGKSTLLKAIAGLLRPESGTVVVDGHDVTGKPSVAAQWIGLMPDPLGVYTDISCREYLQFYGMVHGLSAGEIKSRMETTVEVLELSPWINAEVESLSAGWQRRLALGRMLLMEVPLLLLDEPAAGLDVRARADLLRIVRKLASMKRTIIISSHILPELEELADRFAIMDQGGWADILPGQHIFTRRELREGLGHKHWRILCDAPQKAMDALRKMDITTLRAVEGGITFATDDAALAAGCLAKVTAKNIAVYEFKRVDDGLTNVVLDILEKGAPS